jgi:hypothetical protein
MTQSASVQVGSRCRISLLRAACEHLSISPGDRLLVDIQVGLLILVPQPLDYATHLAGLHQEVWVGLDTTGYLAEERQA